MARQKGTDLDSARTSTRTEKFKITDHINLMKFPEKKWVTGRLWGTLHSYATGWVRGKTKDGKPTKFPVNMPSYDPETQQFDSTKYDPWFKIWEEEKDLARDDQTVQINRKFYGNFLLRAAQRQKPSKIGKPTADERKSGFKDKDSDTWTPWQAVALPPGLIQKIQELKGLNVVTSKKTGSTKAFSVTHERFGCDIQIYYDSSKAPADQYQVQLGDRKPLSEEELAFLRWDTSGLAPEEPSAEEIKRDFESWASRMGRKIKKARKIDDDDIDADDESDDDDDTPKSKGKSKSKPVSKGKKRSDPDEDADDDEDEEDDDLDDDDDDEPVSKSKAKAKSKKRPDPDEDDDEDEEEDDEDDDSESDDEDDDESDDDDSDSDDDEDDLDDDDEDSKPASKSKAKSAKSSKAKSKSRDDDDDEDEDDEDDDLDDDDDEDDTPPVSKSKSKSKATKSKPAAKGKKRSEPDDDEDEEEDSDDEDDDLDDDDDDDDTPPPPKSKAKASTKKPAAKTATKKRK